MASVPKQAVNPAGVLSNMMKFYAEGRFCDVKIQTGDEVFECQRSFLAAISEYFDGMFRGNFKEGDHEHDEPIVLRDIDAEAFKEILNSVRTGILNVNEMNVDVLLRANDFLQIRGDLIEEQCYNYLARENWKRQMSCTFDILSFAFLTEKQRFVKLMCYHIVIHFDHFVKDVKFLEIPFAILEQIPQSYRELVFNNEIAEKGGNTLFCFILCWLNHSRTSRHHHRRDLMNMIDSSWISTDYALSLFNKYEIHVDEAANQGDKIGWLMDAINPSTMLGIKFAIGTTCELVVDKISQTNVEEVEAYRVRDLEWVMDIYHPLGYAYISFHTFYKGNPNTCNAEVVFTIVSQKEGVKDLVKNFAGTFVKEVKEGFPQFIKWEDIVHQEKGYIKNDTVIFQIRVSF